MAGYSLDLRFADARDLYRELAGRLSTEGMFVAMGFPRPVGTAIEFELNVGDDNTLLSGRGEVAWVRGRGEGPDRPAGMGVRFTELDARGAQVVSELVKRRREAKLSVFDLEAERPAETDSAPDGAPDAEPPVEDRAAGPDLEEISELLERVESAERLAEEGAAALQSAERELSEEREARGTLESRLAEAEAERGRLESALAETRAEKEREASEAERRREELKSQIEAAEDVAERAREASMRSAAEGNALEQRLEEAARQLDDSRREKAEAAERLEAAERQLEELRAEVEPLRQEVDGLRGERGRLASELEAGKEEAARARALLERVRSEHAGLQGEFVDLQAVVGRHVQEKAELAQRLEAAAGAPPAIETEPEPAVDFRFEEFGEEVESPPARRFTARTALRFGVAVLAGAVAGALAMLLFAG